MICLNWLLMQHSNISEIYNSLSVAVHVTISSIVLLEVFWALHYKSSFSLLGETSAPSVSPLQYTHISESVEHTLRAKAHASGAAVSKEPVRGFTAEEISKNSRRQKYEHGRTNAWVVTYTWLREKNRQTLFLLSENRQEKKETKQRHININVWNGHYYFIQMPFFAWKIEAAAAVPMQRMSEESPGTTDDLTGRESVCKNHMCNSQQ